MLEELERMAKAAAESLPRLNRRYQLRLRAEKRDKLQRQLLSSITAGAAAAILLEGAGWPAFLIQVENAGRTLAKLDVPADSVAQALHDYDALLAAELARSESGEFERVREYLKSCVILLLSNAYNYVREGETRLFHDIARIELDEQNTETLFTRFLEIFSNACGAAEARVFLFRNGSPRAGGRDRKPRLSSPLFIRRGTPQEEYLLDPEWRGAHESYWSFPLRNGETFEGVMQFGFVDVRPCLPREQELFTNALQWCVQAAKKTILLEDLTSRERELRRLGARMLKVEELERRRVSRALHDEAGQSLVVIRLQLELIELSIAAEDKELRSRLAEIRDITEKTILSIRGLISDLSPAILEQLGLAAAVRQLVNRFRRGYGCNVQFKLSKLPEIPKNIEVIAYRLLQESFRTIEEQSSARNVNISLTSAEGVLRLHVEDDGTNQIAPESEDTEPFGFAGIRARVALLGGKFAMQIPSPADKRLKNKRRGTRLEIELPIPQQE